jgi:tRNA threonylcarbamoyladenosine biosynthesis protein TsaE
MEIQINSIEEINQAAQAFVAAMGKRKVFAFYGKMGAGKTTFIKAVCQTLGVEDVINSPTFAIVNEYIDGQGQPIYHFDFYRIKTPQEVLDIGYEDYVYSGHVCFMEWPELVENLLPDDVVKVTIEENEDGSRTVRTEDFED